VIKVAMVESNGQVQTVVCPSVDSLYVHGQVYGEVTARLIPFTSDTKEVLELWYWHNDEWNTREPMPSNLSKWEGHELGWVTDNQNLTDKIRSQRGIYLINSDWTQGNDSPLSKAKKSEWLIYRQDLRDMKFAYNDLTLFEDIIWPTPPEV
jgi:hypothetical protein|tara:strand:- start:936 stop:1388 length:453 start_codon:yes stop_codon:yes gene_type:complete